MKEVIPCCGQEQSLNQNIEEERTSQLEFLNRCAEFYVCETWQEASPKEKILTFKQIDSSHDEERAYVMTEDEKDLMELGEGLGTMNEIMRKKLVSVPEILWGGLKENIYTDTHIMIMDKVVSGKLLNRELKNYRERTLKTYCEELELEFADALKRLDSEITDIIEKRSLNFVNDLNNRLGKIIGRLENEDTVELKERGFVAQSAVVFSDLEKQKFVMIDGRYYFGLKKEFSKAKFFCNFEGDYPVVGLREEGELKAIILPIMSSGSRYNNFVKKVRGE